MKHKIIFTLILLGLLTACTENEIPQEPTEYSNTDWGFKITIPTGWYIVEETDDGELWLILARQDDISASLNIVALKRPQKIQEMDLKEFMDMYTETLITNVQDYTLLDSSVHTVKGSEAFTLIATYTEKSKTVKTIETTIVKGDKSYSISFLTNPHQFDSYKLQIEQMVNSFELIQ